MGAVSTTPRWLGYPLGDEAQRRKTYTIRALEKNDSARFLSIIEPYENEPVVKSATAESVDKLRGDLTDDRVQEIAIEHLERMGQNIRVTLMESKNDAPVATLMESFPESSRRKSERLQKRWVDSRTEMVKFVREKALRRKLYSARHSSIGSSR